MARDGGVLKYHQVKVYHFPKETINEILTYIRLACGQDS